MTWTDTTWQQVCTLQYGKALKDYQDFENDYPVWGSGGIVGSTAKPIAPAERPIIARKGTLTAYWSKQPSHVIDTAFWLEPNKNLNSRWSYYAVKDLDISTLSSGSGVPSLSRDDFYRKTLRLPPLLEQKTVAHILGTLDDKIELNKKMNQILEDITKVIFKSLFIDFDPVHAKAEGKPTGLPLEISDLFTAEFEDSDLGRIPKGWTVTNLKSISDKITDKFSAKESWKDEKLIDLGRMQSNSLSIYEYGLGSELSTSVCRFKKYDFLFGSIRPYFKKAVIAPFNGVSNTSVFVIRAKNISDSAFLYSHASSNEVFSKSIQYSKGTKMPTISWEDFSSFQFALPSENLRKAYYDFTINFFNKMLSNIEENTILSNIRNTLLPKLISGELQISNAQKFIDEIGL